MAAYSRFKYAARNAVFSMKWSSSFCRKDPNWLHQYVPLNTSSMYDRNADLSNTISFGHSHIVQQIAATPLQIKIIQYNFGFPNQSENICWKNSGGEISKETCMVCQINFAKGQSKVEYLHLDDKQHFVLPKYLLAKLSFIKLTSLYKYKLFFYLLSGF